MRFPWSKKPDSAAAATPHATEAEVAEHLTYLRETIWDALAPGFQTKDDVTESIVELVEDDDDNPLTADDAVELVNDLWQLRLDQLASAGSDGPRDDERVAAAFAELDAAGFAASMYLGWDQGEGFELSYARAKAEGRDRGYVFFHFQDAERLAAPDPVLMIAYGSLESDLTKREAADVVVGEVVQETLEKHGLTVSWDGTRATRIAVVDLDWRRPLPPAD